MSGIDCFLFLTQKITLNQVEEVLVQSSHLLEHWSRYEDGYLSPYYCAVVESRYKLKMESEEVRLTGWSNIYLGGMTRLLGIMDKIELKALNRATGARFRSVLHFSGGSRGRSTAFAVGQLLRLYAQEFGGYINLEYNLPEALFNELPGWKKQSPVSYYPDPLPNPYYTFLSPEAMEAFLKHPFFHIVNPAHLRTLLAAGDPQFLR